MADPFSTMVMNLQNMGFFQFLFPFLLAFAIIYGALKWIFKDEGLGGSRVHALIAVILAFFVMFYSAYNTWLYLFLSTTSGTVLGMATVLLFIVILTSLAGVNLQDVLGGEKAPGWIKYVAILVIVYIVLAVFLGTGSMTNILPYWLTGSDIWTVVLVVIILGVVFWFVGDGGKKEEEKDTPKTAGK